MIAIAVVAVLLFFCFYPETPGMRMCNLKVVNKEGKAIGFKKRLIRSFPGFAFSFVLIAPLTELRSIDFLAALLGFVFIVLYYPLNAVHCLFTKERMSIFDRILKTKIIKEYKLPEMLKPKFFGIRIR